MARSTTQGAPVSDRARPESTRALCLRLEESSHACQNPSPTCLPARPPAALHSAASSGQADVLRVLLRHATDREILCKDKDGANVLHVALDAGNSACLDALLNCDVAEALCSEVDGAGEGPVHKAVAAGDAGMLGALLSAGARTCGAAGDESGVDALHLALSSGKMGLAR